MLAEFTTLQMGPYRGISDHGLTPVQAKDTLWGAGDMMGINRRMMENSAELYTRLNQLKTADPDMFIQPGAVHTGSLEIIHKAKIDFYLSKQDPSLRKKDERRLCIAMKPDGYEFIDYTALDSEGRPGLALRPRIQPLDDKLGRKSSALDNVCAQAEAWLRHQETTYPAASAGAEYADACGLIPAAPETETWGKDGVTGAMKRILKRLSQLDKLGPDTAGRELTVLPIMPETQEDTAVIQMDFRDPSEDTPSLDSRLTFLLARETFITIQGGPDAKAEKPWRLRPARDYEPTSHAEELIEEITLSWLNNRAQYDLDHMKQIRQECSRNIAASQKRPRRLGL